jgi:5-methylcytosine-specific restriction protein A
MTAVVGNREAVTTRHTFSMPVIAQSNAPTPAWESAVNYLLRTPGRWVSSEELAHFLYQGVCGTSAPRMAVQRARQRGFPIESGVFGYRIGRPVRNDAQCPQCSTLRCLDAGEWICYGCMGTEFVDLDLDRPGYDPDSRQGKEWSEEENAELRRLWGKLTQAEIGELLLRSEGSVRAQGATLGLGKKPYRYRGWEAMTWKRDNRGYAGGRRLPDAVRQQVLTEEPVCRGCGVAPSRHVDHIEGARRRPELFGVRANLQGLCGPCHRLKTARVDSKPQERRNRPAERHPGEILPPGGIENLGSPRGARRAGLPARDPVRVFGVDR